MVDLEAGEGTPCGQLRGCPFASTCANCEQLVKEIRSSLRSDLREELCIMKRTVYVPAINAVHDSVQQTLVEVEERLQAALAGRPRAAADGQHAAARAAAEPEAPAVPSRCAPSPQGSSGCSPGCGGDQPRLPRRALLPCAALAAESRAAAERLAAERLAAEGSPPPRRQWRWSPSRAAAPRDSPPAATPAAAGSPRGGSSRAAEADASPRSPAEWMARCYTDRTSHVQGSQEWRHHMTRRVTSKLAVAGTRALPQVSGILTSSTLTAMQTVASSHNVHPRATLQSVVNSIAFEMVSFSLILANTVIASIRIDRFATCARSGCPSGHDRVLAWADEFFLGLLLAEVVLRITATRWKYFVGDMWQWNVLDVLLAAWGVHAVCQGRSTFTYTRIVRFFRLVRLLRVTSNALCLRDLRLMACTLLQSLVSIFWAFVLLFVVMYCFGACFTDAVSGFLAGTDRTGASDGHHVHEDSWRRLDQLYGSLPRTMWTLLLAITNGADWTTLAEPLADVHMVYVAIFAVYVVLVLVGALNVLTSVFVERARELSSSDRDLATQAELASQEAFIVEMRRIFEEVDGDKDGMITWEKFRDYLKNEQAQAFFTTQALDTSDAAGLFSLLDKDGRGKIKVEDFALGCMKLRGQAKSSEVATLLRESRKASRKLMTEIRQLKDQLELGQPGEVEHAGLRRGAARRAASCTPSRTGRSGTFVHAWSQYDAASPPTSRQCCS